MQAIYKRPRKPSQAKIDRDVQRFERAASRLLLTISAIEATQGGIDCAGNFTNPLSQRFEGIIAARDLVRGVLS